MYTMNLHRPLPKAMYVAAVTAFCTFLGCWAVLAHQEITHTQAHAAVSDEQFAKKAAQGGMAEVKMGQLAQEKGTNESVKQFGQRMVEDHTKANDELNEAARKENVTLPTDLDAKDKATYDALAQLSGAAFDRVYARDMVRDHQEDIAEFNREAKGGQKEAIKSFAVGALPILNDHQKDAREMQRSVSGTKATPNSSGTAKKSSGAPGSR
jgi:putative membrane protein